jgi:hypothetical protein
MAKQDPEYYKKYYETNKQRIFERRKNKLESLTSEEKEKLRQRYLYLQRIRFHNPVVREKHRISCIKSKEKKSHSSNLVSLANIRAGEFDISFD